MRDSGKECSAVAEWGAKNRIFIQDLKCGLQLAVVNLVIFACYTTPTTWKRRLFFVAARSGIKARLS
jgi:hypothetical protein